MPCVLNRRSCPPESAPSRNWPRKSSCAPRRPRQPTNLVTIVGRFLAAEAACSATAERHAAARNVHQDRRQHWLDLREQRLTNAAAELATQLLAGVPCPVCGSPEHPAPAPAAASALAVAEAEEAAQLASDMAEEAFAALGRDLADAQQNVAVLAAQGGSTPAGEARCGSSPGPGTGR